MYLFDGNDHIDAANNAVQGVDVDTFSISCLISVTNTPTTDQQPFTLAALLAGGNFRFSFDVVAPSTGSGWRFRVTQGFSGNAFAQWRFNADLALNTVYQIGVDTDSLAANDPVLRVNGASGAQTELSTPSGTRLTGVDSSKMGEDLGGTSDFSGTLGEVAFWANVRHTTDVWAALGKKFAPIFFRNGLVLYLPMIRGVADVMGKSGAWAITGAVVSPHPAVIYPTGIPVIAVPDGTTLVSASDALSVGLTEAGIVSGSNSAADTMPVSGTEAAAAAVSFNAPDTLVVQLTEASTIAATIAAPDTIVIGLSEGSSSFAAGSASETVEIHLIDVATAQSDAVTSIPAADTLEIHLTEAASVVPSIAAQDDLAVHLTETATVSATLATSDSLAVPANELAVCFVSANGADACLVGLDETASPMVLLATADSCASVFDEVAQVAMPLTATDACGIGCTDAITNRTETLAREHVGGANLPFIPGLIASPRMATIKAGVDY